MAFYVYCPICGNRLLAKKWKRMWKGLPGESESFCKKCDLRVLLTDYSNEGNVVEITFH